MTKQEFDELFLICQGIYEYHDQKVNDDFIKYLIFGNAELNASELIRVLVKNIDDVKFGEVGAYLQAGFSHQQGNEEHFERLFDGKVYGRDRFPRSEH